jgi:hypothetical protein
VALAQTEICNLFFYFFLPLKKNYLLSLLQWLQLRESARGLPYWRGATDKFHFLKKKKKTDKFHRNYLLGENPPPHPFFSFPLLILFYRELVSRTHLGGSFSPTFQF